MKALVVATLGVALLATPPPDGVDPEAWTIAERGIAAYEAGDYGAARDDLRRAYARSPHPAILYAWAQAERNAGHCEAAASLYELFLESATSQAQREYAEHHLEACRRELADDKPPPAQPPPKVEPTPPPRAAPPPEPPPPADPPPDQPVTTDSPRPSRGRVAAIVTTLTLGGAAFVTGVTLLGVGQSRVTAQRGAENYERFDSLDRQIASMRIGGGVSLGIAVPLIVVGAVLAVRQSKARRSSRLTPSAGLPGAQLRF